MPFIPHPSHPAERIMYTYLHILYPHKSRRRRLRLSHLVYCPDRIYAKIGGAATPVSSAPATSVKTRTCARELSQIHNPNIPCHALHQSALCVIYRVEVHLPCNKQALVLPFIFISPSLSLFLVCASFLAIWLSRLPPLVNNNNSTTVVRTHNRMSTDRHIPHCAVCVNLQSHWHTTRWDAMGHDAMKWDSILDETLGMRKKQAKSDSSCVLCVL